MSAPKLLDRLEAKQAEVLAAEVMAREYSEPAQIAELSGVTFEEPGLFHWRGWIVPTRGTMPAYRKYFDETFNL